MNLREREGLIARVRHLRRVAAADAQPEVETVETDPARLESLAARLEHLERLVEGLQDSVHRESQRAGDRLADLEARIEPTALVAALSKDARERGLS
jgi:hypothetical protein